MSFIGDLVGDIFGGITGAKQAGEAAERGSATQAAAAQAGIEEQRRQFDKFVELMSPYVTAGTGAFGRLEPFQAAGEKAFGQQQALLGLRGPEEERAAIERLSSGETFKSLAQQGEEALLSRASATGGLRGGNIQAALGQFRPQLLSSLIEQQYGRLGGLSATGLGVTSDILARGQASAAGQAAGGMTSASNVANLLANQGQAIAGGQVAAGGVPRQTFSDILGIGTAAAKIAPLFSDRRLKKNIKQISVRPDGLNVYEFDYIWGGDRQIGLIAQEVKTIYPSAVSESSGFLMVDYSKV